MRVKTGNDWDIRKKKSEKSDIEKADSTGYGKRLEIEHKIDRRIKDRAEVDIAGGL